MIGLIVTTWAHIIEFLHNEATLPFKWQTLLGSIVGPVLAFYASILYQSRKEKRENIRITEVSLTRTLNDIYESREGLRNFLDRLNGIIESAESAEDSFFVTKTNFPNNKIFLGEQLSDLRLHSLYLHNKLLWIEAGTRNIDIGLTEMRESFTGILSDSRENMQNMTPVQQRQLLSQELRGFSTWVTNLIEYYNLGIKMLAQAKVYNLMLKEKGRKLTIWKFEKLPFKYYLKKSEFKKKYTSIFEMQKRIDGIIEPEVSKIINEAEKRLGERVAR